MEDMKHFLAVDIGNTNVSFAVMKGKYVRKVFSLDTCQGALVLQKKVRTLVRLLKKKHSGLAMAVVCSVVPRTLKVIMPVLKQEFSGKVFTVGRNISVPIKNNYKNPGQVGQDRLVGAYAAKELYGFPCIVIDLGTAITFDVVSHKGSYEGGLIVPGIRLSIESLFQKTAMLPRVDKIKQPRSIIGKDTQASILSGIFNGYGALCGGLIDKISRGTQGNPKVIITGGHTEMMKKFIVKKVFKVDQYLVFRGLELMLRQMSHR